jgi:hypothetical protein
MPLAAPRRSDAAEHSVEQYRYRPSHERHHGELSLAPRACPDPKLDHLMAGAIGRIDDSLQEMLRFLRLVIPNSMLSQWVRTTSLG